MSEHKTVTFPEKFAYRDKVYSLGKTVVVFLTKSALPDHGRLHSQSPSTVNAIAMPPDRERHFPACIDIPRLCRYTKI